MPARFGVPGTALPNSDAFWRAVDDAIGADGPEQARLARELGAGSMLRAHDTPAAEWIARNIPALSEGAEIGVWRGQFSKLLIDRGVARLHLVDPWAYQPSFPLRVFGGKKGRQQDAMDAIYEEVREMFAGNPAVTLHRKMSSDALDDVEDESLDWVYVDGNHHYEWVLADLQGWWEKLKPGGLLAGDDFMWGEMYGRPVRRAVLEFVSRGTVDFISAERKYFVLRKRMEQKMIDDERFHSLSPLGMDARVANLCTARTGSSSVTSRLRHLFARTPTEAQLAAWMDKRISRHSLGTRVCLTHHDHRLTVRDLEEAGVRYIVATIRAPADRIASGHRRRIDGMHNNHPQKAKIAHLGNQRNQKKAQNQAYLAHFGTDINTLVEHLQRPGGSTKIAEAVGGTLDTNMPASSSGNGQWWLRPVVEGYLNGQSEKTRIFWLRCEHLDQDWDTLLTLWSRDSSSLPASCSPIDSSPPPPPHHAAMNVSSAASRVTPGVTLNKKSLAWIRSNKYARDVDLWRAANAAATAPEGGALLVTDGRGRPIPAAGHDNSKGVDNIKPDRPIHHTQDDVVVVSVSNNHSHPNVTLLRGTCPFRLIYDAFPHGGHWTSNREKLKATLNVACRLDPLKIVCHVDAFDVVLTPTFRSLPRAFESFIRRDESESRASTRVLVSVVRTRPFPLDGVLAPFLAEGSAAESHAHQQYVKTQPGQSTPLSRALSAAGYPNSPEGCDWNVYANSGAYVGYAKDIVRMLELMLRIAGGNFEPAMNGTRAGNSDQELFHAALLTQEGRDLMCLDAASAFFCSLGPRPRSQIVPRAWTRDKPWEVRELGGGADQIPSCASASLRNARGGPVFDFKSADARGFPSTSSLLELPEFQISVNSPAQIELRQASKHPRTDTQFPLVIHGNGGPETSAKRAFSEVFVPAVEQMLLLSDEEGAFGRGARRRWVKAALEAKDGPRPTPSTGMANATGEIRNPRSVLEDESESLFSRRDAVKRMLREGKRHDVLKCLNAGMLQPNILLALEVAHQLGPMEVFGQEKNKEVEVEDVQDLNGGIEMAAHQLFARFRRLGAAIRLIEEEDTDNGREVYHSPDFLILGAPKCGTTSLVQYLLRVPGLQFSSRHGGSVNGVEEEEIAEAVEVGDVGMHDPMEVHVFDRTHGCDDFARFRLAALSMRLRGGGGGGNWSRTGHCTPMYLHHEDAPQNALSILPKKARARLCFVIMTRDPIERSISSWRFKTRTGQETRGFAEAVRAGMAAPNSHRPRSCRHVGISMYHRHIARWKEAFPDQEGAPSRFHICRLEDLSRDPRGTLRDILLFLGARADVADAALLDNTALDSILGKRFNAAVGSANGDEKISDVPGTDGDDDDAAALQELTWFFSSSELVRRVNPSVDAQTDSLVVTFGGMGGKFGGILPFEFSSFMKKSDVLKQVDQMFFVDKAQRHYLRGIGQISTDVAGTAAYLSSKIRGYKNVVFVGTSAGGYAAILFGSLLRVASVLAFVPQTVLEGSKQTEASAAVDPRYKDIKPFLNEETRYTLFSWHKDVYTGNHGRHHCDHLVDSGAENVRVVFTEDNVKGMRDSGRLESIFRAVL
jgi:hypothetical protein